jgi:NADPH-dependent curcumin reductase CurA
MKIDHAIDRRAEDVSRDSGHLLCRVERVLDNVGGEILNAAVDNMGVHGRIAVAVGLRLRQRRTGTRSP